MELKTVTLNIPEGANLILGQAHFIKTVEDLFEIMITTVPGVKFVGRSVGDALFLELSKAIQSSEDSRGQGEGQIKELRP